MLGYQLAHLDKPSEILPEALSIFIDELSMLPFSTSSSMSDIIQYLIACPPRATTDIDLVVFQRPTDNHQKFVLTLGTDKFYMHIGDKYVKDAKLEYDYIPIQFAYYKDSQLCKRRIIRRDEILTYLPESLKKLTIDDIIKIALDQNSRFDIYEHKTPVKYRELVVTRFHDVTTIRLKDESVARGHEYHHNRAILEQYPITPSTENETSKPEVIWDNVNLLRRHPRKINQALFNLLLKIPDVDNLTIAEMSKDNTTTFCKKSSTLFVHSLHYTAPNPVNVDVRIVNTFEKEYEQPASNYAASDFHSFSECHLTLPQLIAWCYNKPECFITSSTTNPSGRMYYTTIKIRYFYSYIIISGYSDTSVTENEPTNNDIYADVSKVVLTLATKKPDSVEKQKKDKAKALSEKEKKVSTNKKQSSYLRNKKICKKENELMRAVKPAKESSEKEQLYPVSFGRDGNGGTLMLPFKPETPIQEVLQSFDMVLTKEKECVSKDSYIMSHHFLNNGMELIISRDFKKLPTQV